MTAFEMFASGFVITAAGIFASAVTSMVAATVVAHKAGKIDQEFCDKAQSDTRCMPLHISPTYTFYTSARLVAGALFGFKGESLSESDKEVVGLAVGLKPNQTKELA